MRRVEANSGSMPSSSMRLAVIQNPARKAIASITPNVLIG